jgi:hypothetical protein
MQANNPDLASQIAAEIMARRKDAHSRDMEFLVKDMSAIIREMLPVAPPRGSRAGAISEAAERIYALYPRKVAPLAAKRAIMVALKTTSAEVLLDATAEYGKAVAGWPFHLRKNKDGVDMVPHPATWFNRGSFNDDRREWYKGRAGAPKQAAGIPPEPNGWREEFPNLLDPTVRWEDLDTFSRNHIITTLETAKAMTAAVDADAYSTHLRNA